MKFYSKNKSAKHRWRSLATIAAFLNKDNRINALPDDSYDYDDNGDNDGVISHDYDYYENDNDGDSDHD